MNTSSVTICPRPPQTGQPPLLLKENNDPFTLFSAAMTLRISSKKPRKVAGVERPVAVTGDWSTPLEGRVKAILYDFTIIQEKAGCG